MKPPLTPPTPLLHLHSLGYRDQQIADALGISISTVKRQRQKLGLPGNCPKNHLGRRAEDHVLRLALAQGLSASRNPDPHASFDLWIEGKRVEVKATRPDPTGGHRFRLDSERVSNHGRYSYQKDYSRDCDVIALVRCDLEGNPMDVFFIPSSQAGESIYLGASDLYEQAREDWSLFRVHQVSPFLA